MKPSGLVMLILGICLIGWLTLGGYGRVLAKAVWNGDNGSGGDIRDQLPKQPNFKPNDNGTGGGGGGGAW